MHWAYLKVWVLVPDWLLTSSVTGRRSSLALVLLPEIKGFRYIISKAFSFWAFSEVRHEDVHASGLLCPKISATKLIFQFISFCRLNLDSVWVYISCVCVSSSVVSNSL